MHRLHGKPLDVARLKKPVLESIRGHLEKIEAIVGYLASNEQPVEQEQCYICGDTKRAPLTSIHGFDYVTCATCTHAYTTKRYSDEAIRRFYETNAYWAEVTYANKETCLYRRESVAHPKVDFIEEQTGLNGGTWLDVGSGIGDLVSVASEKGWQAQGLELSETSVAFAKEMFDVTLSRRTLSEHLGAEPGLQGSYDVISMIGLLEHVVDPLSLLSLAHGALKPGGYVAAQVPSANSIASMTQSVFPENVFRHMSPIEHIMLFTEPSLALAFEKSGFEPVSYWYHGLDIYELLNNLCLANERVIGSPLYDQLLSLFNQLQQVIDEAELSDRIICIAKKV